MKVDRRNKRKVTTTYEIKGKVGGPPPLPVIEAGVSRKQESISSSPNESSSPQSSSEDDITAVKRELKRRLHEIWFH